MSVQMDSEGIDAKICNGSKPSPIADSEGTGKREEEDGETSSLLSPALKKGGMKGRRQRSRRKKVQWNDCNGNKLVEIMEFQPSDSSDSEDECHPRHWICYRTLAGCAHICCCRLRG